jgi:hypothetical protein
MDQDPTTSDPAQGWLDEAHRYLDWARERGANLDGRDDSIWFVYGVLLSMIEEPDEPTSERAIKCLSFAVYVAEMLAATVHGVQVVVDGDEAAVREVMAVGSATQHVLSWVTACLADPEADNIVFKYAGALKDLGETERAQTLYTELESLSAEE